MKNLSLIITLFLLVLSLTPALAQAPEGEEYIVQADDWLSKIAEKEYGNVLTYPAIVEATNAKAAEDNSFAVIDDPNVIEVGQKLWLPNEVDPTLVAKASAATAEVEYAFSPVGTITRVACPEYTNLSAVSESEVEGETYECGLVTVPENHANPNGRTIELLYFRMFSPSDSPAPDPLLYLSGGPGGSGLSEMNPVGSIILPNLLAIRQTRDVVVYDQRGTGFSSPLLCGPTEAGIGAAVELLPERADDIRKIENDDTGSKILNYGLCGAFYESVGVDLTQFNSVASTQDMASLMTALGYDQYNLYGTSYGTKLALVAVRETPDRVRTIVIDGIVALTTSPMGTSMIEFDEQFTHIFEQCAQDPACNEAYPNLPERFTALLDKLADNPIVLDEPIMPTGFIKLLIGEDSPLVTEGITTIDAAFMNTLTTINNHAYNHLLGDDYSIAGQIPRLVLALEEGDIDYVRGMFQMPDLPGTAPVEEVTVFEDEQTVLPDNEFIAASIETLLAEAETAVSDATTPEEQWVALIVNNLNQRLTAGEAQTEIVRDMIELTGLPYQGLDKQVLIDYANEYLPEEGAAEANAIAEPMTDEDVRATMWHIYGIAAAMSFGGEDVSGLHYGYLFAVNCPEDVDLRSAAVVEEAIATAAYPQLAEAGPEQWGLFEIACRFYPDAAIDASFIEPVVSDVPALLLQGALDTQTPPSEARATASTLENGVFVLFESEGHVVGSKDAQCPGAITVQFLNNPTGQIDTSCADAFVLNFELP